MWTYNYSNELYHHGVKGQKWGVRRVRPVGAADRYVKKKNDAYKQKWKNVYENDKTNSDAKYHSSSVGQKVARNVARATVRNVGAAVIKGEIPKTKADIARMGVKIARESARSMAVNELKGRTQVTKYNAEGQQTKKVTAATAAYGTAKVLSIPAVNKSLGAVAAKKYFTAKANREANKATFDKMAGHLLEEKFDDIVGEATYRILD